MLRSSVAHVRSEERDSEGRCYAITMFNRLEKGVLVYAGRLRSTAESKDGEAITADDYELRQTASFMWWQDVRQYFSRPPYRALVERLIAEYKRNERATDASARAGMRQAS